MRSLVIGTAGHIDHGKSSLVEALTGTHPDRLKEERERGITIDLGFAHTSIGDVNVGFVDVPGHERFVRNMLAGAGGIDGVLLVVAANESVMPQTREHFDICRLLGIEQGVIALTKRDLVTAEALEFAELEVKELVAGSFLEAAPIVAVSARAGTGLDGLRSALASIPQAASRGVRPSVVRLPIDRVFVMKGFVTVVTGTLISGTVHETADLTLLPAGRQVRVRGIHVHGTAVADAAAPTRVAINLGAIDAAELARGMTLATPDAVAVTRRLDARVELLRDAPPLKHGARVRVHLGTSDIAGRIAIAAVREAAGDGWRQIVAGDSGSVPPHGEAFVRIRLEQPAVATRLDRLVLRVYSPAATIGGAVVLDPEPPAAGLRRPGSLDRFLKLDSAAFDHWLDEAGVRGLDLATLVRRGGLDPVEASALEERWLAAGRAKRSGAYIFSSAAVREMEDRILNALTTFHGAHPLEPGMPRETVRDAAAARARPELFDAVVASLGERRAIEGGDRLGLWSHRQAMSEEEARGRERIEQIIREAGLTPPDVAYVQSNAGIAPATANSVIQLLVRERRLVRLDTLLFHADALATLRREIQALKGTAPDARVDVASFKERYGLSRKYAIPLLEWLDRERVTRRVGDRRVIL